MIQIWLSDQEVEALLEARLLHLEATDEGYIPNRLANGLSTAKLKIRKAVQVQR